jgi:hypothetical protein
MSVYLLKRAIEQLKLSDAHLAAYASALRRRMDAAVEISAKGGPMPPMDPLIDELEQRLDAAACDSVLHWRVVAWEILSNMAAERFIAWHADRRNVLIGPEAGNCV